MDFLFLESRILTLSEPSKFDAIFVPCLNLNIMILILSFLLPSEPNKFDIVFVPCCLLTSHSAYVATETELVGTKIDGLLPSNFL